MTTAPCSQLRSPLYAPNVAVPGPSGTLMSSPSTTSLRSGGDRGSPGGLQHNPSTGSLRQHGQLGQSVSLASIMTTGTDGGARIQEPPRSAPSVLGDAEALHARVVPGTMRQQRAQVDQQPVLNSQFQRLPERPISHHTARHPPPPSTPLAPAAARPPTWVIEEVIDFGLPSDEACDVDGHMLGLHGVCMDKDQFHRMCKPASTNFGLWDDCLRATCSDGNGNKDPDRC
mmetsp:Transcript_88764/g.250014  ORF Transcript_88764/g.250014 Transcript_88764/m.250014 type:complete len:229 (-) Transcript_88764:153-839(-)